MDKIPYSHIERGTLLVATPDISAGVFFRAVVLVCEHNPAGSFGLIVNKSLELQLPEEIMNMEQLLNPHIGVRAGGPIQTHQMMLLHGSDKIPHQTIEICKDVYLGGDLLFLQEILQDVQGPPVNLCFGYTGWVAGQLEREFLDGHWYLLQANAQHIFETPPEKLWQIALREMGGKYAPLSLIPEDLSLN